MADSLNTTNLSRRCILGTRIAAAGAVSVLGCLPVQAAEADAKLLQLLEAYKEAEAKDNEAYCAWDESQGNAKEQAGPPYLLGCGHRSPLPEVSPPESPASITRRWTARLSRTWRRKYQRPSVSMSGPFGCRPSRNGRRGAQRHVTPAEWMNSRLLARSE
jgi:hypothetical protein